MRDTKSMLLKLILAYAICVVSVAAIGLLVVVFTGSLSRGDGFPLPLVPLITLSAALILLGIFVCIGIGIAVYHDAKRRDMEPLLWALVAALVPYFIGLIAYLIARKPAQTFCAECGGTIPERSAYCPQCGRAMQTPCPNCGRPADPSARFCAHCGTPVTAGAPSADSLAQPR